MKAQNLTDVSITRQEYFSTLVYSTDIGDENQNVNEELLRLIYAEKDRDMEGLERSNFRSLGSWHSHNHLHRNPGFAPVVSLVQILSQHIAVNLGYAPTHELVIGTMWAIINPPGCYNRAHIHPESLWSGVYYVQAPENSGDIEFTDPRTQHLVHQAKFKLNQRRPRECWTKVTYTPKAGKMLLFPAWLYHAVNPNLSREEGVDGDRVIISFNLLQRRR